MDITLTPEQIKLVNIVEHLFKKPDDDEAGKLFYTTMDLYSKLQTFYPSDTYLPADLCEVLVYMKIEIINGSGDTVFWYLEQR
jgi:hypothetical protein